MQYNGKAVPAVVIRRLPRYYRYLGELLKQDIRRISSGALSEKMNVTASQIRQDFNYFGGFGQQGYGYNVEYLYQEIGAILGLDEGYRTILVGAGNLGHALANHGAFEKRGFRLMAIFDNDPKMVGTVINGVEVLPDEEMEAFVKEQQIEIAILALPKAATQKIADALAEWGIKGLWNFSYVELKTKKNVAVENVHMIDSLMTLSYKIKQAENE
ncbi:MAG: redox-sensing transcriptional repressor Rex [Ruminococcaceae bacterium]|nr:redox-sensing transcriptional repressor Rex [Oscillospiraceae bacterium]